MIGTIRMHQGQRFWVGNTSMYQRPDGSLGVMLVWASQCTDCGEQFEFTAPAASTKFEPNRRCQKHKRPGCRVKVVA